MRDVEEFLKRVEDEKRAVANEMNSSGTYWGKWKQYLKPHVYKTFFIIHFFRLMQIVCRTYLFEFCVPDIILSGKTGLSLDRNFVMKFVMKLKLTLRFVLLPLVYFYCGLEVE